MLISYFVNAVLVAVTVLIHYEALYRVSHWMPRIPGPHRYRILFALSGVLFAHVVEIWMFGGAMYLMLEYGDFGSLSGNFEGSLLDCVYFSFTNYTSLGFGDIEPSGDLRFVAGLEALTGLVMIAWTASFVYIEMQRFWDVR